MMNLKTTIFLVNLYLVVLGFKMSIEGRNQGKELYVLPSNSRIKTYNHKNTAFQYARSAFDPTHKTQRDSLGETLRFTGDIHSRRSEPDAYNEALGSKTILHKTNERSHSDPLFTHFEEVVETITHGVKIDNSVSKKCVCTEKIFILCNCSNLNAQYVPTDMLPSMEGLDLFRNMITSLAGALFRKYKHLLYLSLQGNQVTILTNDSFLGLEKLLVLDLRQNKLVMTAGTYQNGVFNTLPRLIALRLNRNNKHPYYSELFYPHRALSVLRSLRLLSMDGLRNIMFGQGFKLMVSLETLTLGGYHDGYCCVNSLPTGTFENLEGLRVLNMSDCSIDRKGIDISVLSPLRRIHTLDFTWNERIGIHLMSTMLGELKESNLKKLVISRIERRFSPGTTVTGEQVRKLPRNLTHLVASDNSINFLDPEVLCNLPKSLQHLDVSGNKMVFGDYLKNFSLLENLETLYADGYGYTFAIPLHYPSPLQPQDNRHYPNSDAGSNEMKGTIPSHDMVLSLPPKLRVLTMNNAGLWYYLSKLNISTNNSLERLHLSGNVFTSAHGPLIGLSKLKYLYLSKCFIKTIHEDFFKGFPSLEFLDLSSNLIGLDNSLSYAPFKFLTNLKHLNLYFNGIRRLYNDSFWGLKSIEELFLDRNQFYLFNSSISHMKRLRTINLSSTDIHTLKPETTKHLDSLHKVKVYMQDTPIKCVCPNLDFLKWMTRSKAMPTNSSHICVLSDLSSKSFSWESFQNEVNIVRRECVSNYALLMPVIGATLLFFVLIAGSIAYRYRWRLRYFYYGLDLRLDKRNKIQEGEFKYDVFVSYSSDDLDFVMSRICPELNQRGVSLCLHTRDFHAGENIITNIIRCVKESRRTLVILTNKLLESKWCRCEFQMAKEEALVTGRKILVSLLVEEIPKDKIWLELRANIEQNTYLPYPGYSGDVNRGQDEENRIVSDRETKRFWDKVVRDITS